LAETFYKKSSNPLKLLQPVQNALGNAGYCKQIYDSNPNQFHITERLK